MPYAARFGLVATALALLAWWMEQLTGWQTLLSVWGVLFTTVVLLWTRRPMRSVPLSDDEEGAPVLKPRHPAAHMKDHDDARWWGKFFPH